MEETRLNEFDKLAELSWKDMLYEIISTLDPWDVNIIELSARYSKKVDEMQKMDFHIPANVMLVSSILLRMKADVLHFSDLEESEEEFDYDYADYADPEFNEFNENLDSELEIPIIIKPRRVPKRKVTAIELISAIQEVIGEKLKKVKNKKIKFERMIIPLEPDIKKLIEEIYNKILNILKKKETVTFSEITKKREDRIRVFLSLLHLSNNQKVKIKQEKMFEEIFIRGV